MLCELPGETGKSLRADKAHDTTDFVADYGTIAVTPHAAQNITHRTGAIDQRTTRHPGYAVSQVIRKLIETIFGNAKERGGMRQFKVRSLQPAQQSFMLECWR